MRRFVPGRARGDRGERRAEAWLKRRGLKPVARNWHCRHGELDLVMYDGECLVFVEVRLRAPRGFASGFESVDRFKQRKLVQAASMFLAGHPGWQDRPCRFDVVALEGERDEPVWLKGAFEAEPGV